MSTSLEELRRIVNESLKEFNTNAAGSTGAEIHAFSVPNEPNAITGTGDIAPNEADIANAIVVAIKHLVNPIGDEEGESARAMELENCRRVLESWVQFDDALNTAARQAAETLLSELDLTTISHSKASGPLGYGY